MADKVDSGTLLRGVRWLTAVAVLVAVIVVTLVSSVGHDIQVCHGSPLVCRPIELDDPPLLSTYMLVLLLLLPDLSRIRIAGILELEREVKATRGELEKTHRDLVSLRQELNLKLSVTSEHHNHINFLPPGAAEGAEQSVEKKTRREHGQ